MNVIQKVSARRPSIQALAEWSLRDEQVYHSDLVGRQSRLVVLDTIGCALAGTRSDVAAPVLHYVLDSGGAPQCTVIGSHLKTSLPMRCWSMACACAALISTTSSSSRRTASSASGDIRATTFRWRFRPARCSGARWGRCSKP